MIEVTPSTNNVAMFRRSHVASKSATLIKHLDETDADYASNINSFQEALVTFEEFVATKFNSGNQYSQRIPKPTGVSAEKFDVAIEQYGAATLATKFTELSIDPDTDTEIVALNSRIEGVVNNVSVRENTELDDIYDLRDENNNPIPNELRFPPNAASFTKNFVIKEDLFYRVEIFKLLLNQKLVKDIRFHLL